MSSKRERLAEQHSTPKKVSESGSRRMSREAVRGAKVRAERVGDPLYFAASRDDL